MLLYMDYYSYSLLLNTFANVILIGAVYLHIIIILQITT